MKIIYTLFFQLVGLSMALACSCIAINNFCETIADQNGEIWPELIVVAEKSGNYLRGSVFKVEEVLHGDHSLESIKVRDGNGADCGQNTQIFDRGDKLILALHPSWIDNGPSDSEFDLSICGVTWLEMDNNTIKGQITANQNRMSLAKFRELDACGNFSTTNLKKQLSVLPTLTREKVIVESIDIATTDPFEYQLFDLNGRLLLQGKFVAGERIELNLGSFSSGLYLLNIALEEKRATYKIAKQN